MAKTARKIAPISVMSYSSALQAIVHVSAGGAILGGGLGASANSITSTGGGVLGGISIQQIPVNMFSFGGSVMGGRSTKTDYFLHSNAVFTMSQSILFFSSTERNPLFTMIEV
jgi:hypothetical protein